jgi:hypothetical protein
VPTFKTKIGKRKSFLLGNLNFFQYICYSGCGNGTSFDARGCHDGAMALRAQLNLGAGMVKVYAKFEN